ncbi:MAG: YheC/YheD family protein, partial [Bacillota bacterium]
MNKQYTVTRTKHKRQIWTIPGYLMPLLRLKQRDTVILQCGSAATRVRVHAKPAGSSDALQMGLSAGALEALKIPDNTSFQIKPAGEKIFRLGPVIGILTFYSHIANQKLGYYKNTARMNIPNGLLYVFSGRHINVKNQTINGYYYDHVHDTWTPGIFPFPDVVIDRCYPNVKIYHALLEKVIGPGKIFNKKSCINKLDFHTTLNANPFLKKHIPETGLFQKSSDLTSYLLKHQEVFLKPVNAMEGKGIVVVKSTPKNLLACKYMSGGRTVTRQIPAAGRIFSVLEAAAGRKRPYIIQQAIPRMKYRGGPFSFRTWAMKYGKGRWVIPGMFAKAASGDGFLTNFMAGAKLIPLKDLFNDIVPRLPYTKRQLIGMLEDLTLKTAAALDKKYGPLGELGLDIIFDDKGKPWLIEANGNPGKIPIFIQKDYPLWRYLVYMYPLAYAS